MSPFALTGLLTDSASGHIAILTGAMGPNMAILSASASGATAIGEAAEMVKRGDAEIVVAGACEAPITPLLYASFAAMRGLATFDEHPADACRPFDASRTGFVIAEGSGAMVLESGARRAGAKPYAELAGYGSNDATWSLKSRPAGAGLAIRQPYGGRIDPKPSATSTLMAPLPAERSSKIRDQSVRSTCIRAGRQLNRR
jgi:3-oxoacyl-[acyl-carrier-protein] synthase II